MEMEAVIDIEVDVEQSGPRGKDGLSAYEIYVKNGGILTETEWLESLKGQDGITPTIGDNGNWYLGDIDTGNPSRGEKGENGTDGYTPVKGTDYWTEEDKNEIKSYCDSLITGSLGGSY